MVYKYGDIIVKDFESIGNNGKYKVRLLKPNNGKLALDIREYVEYDGFTGFTKKGVRLGWDDIQALLRILPEVEDMMDKEG